MITNGDRIRNMSDERLAKEFVCVDIPYAGSNGVYYSQHRPEKSFAEFQNAVEEELIYIKRECGFKMETVFVSPPREEFKQEMFRLYSSEYCGGKELTDKQKQCVRVIAMLMELNFTGQYAGRELPPTATKTAKVLDEMLIKVKESEES